MDGKSLDITKDKLELLRTILPEAFSEAKVDWEKLRLTLGEDINIRVEISSGTEKNGFPLIKNKPE